MTVIVVGGTGGVGRALVQRLRTRGTPVHAVARDSRRLGALAAETGASTAIADVTDGPSLREAILAAGPAVDGLAYCVGSITLKPFHRLAAADYLADFRLNALGAAEAVAAALPALRAASANTASVVLFSSVAAGQVFANHASIGMAKAAVEGLSRSLAAELAPKIRVNCIAPSLTRTPLAAPLTGSAQMAGAIAQMHPLPRLGEPEDVAALAAFLLGPEADWITGQVLGVDGGRSSLRTKG